MTRERRIAPLVVRCGAMGDMVIVLSLVAALHRRFGVPVDLVSSGGWTRPLLEGQPGVGRVHLVGSRRMPLRLSRTQRQVVADLRARGPGPAWVCDRGHWARQLLSHAGFAPDWIAVAERDCPYLPGEHHVDRWLRFSQMIPAALRAQESRPESLGTDDLRSPPLVVLPQWRADLDAWLDTKGLLGRPLVLVQAGNKRTMRWWAPRWRGTNTKYWPEERWAGVIRAVLDEDAGTRVLLLGVPGEAPLNDAIAAEVRSDRVLNAARELPIPRLLALQERAIGMISVDTGPAHSAAALGCPLVVLFGEASTERYAPRSPSGRVVVIAGRDDRDHGRPSILGIRTGDVTSAWQRLRAGNQPWPEPGRDQPASSPSQSLGRRNSA